MNILLFGGGWVAKMVYVPFLSLLDEVEKIYIFDLDMQAAKENFSSFKKVNFVSKSEINHVEYEIVCILTPNHLHAKNIKSFLKKNIKILVEKPLCIHPKELSQIKCSLVSNPATLHVSAPFRYREDIRQIKNIINSEKIGHSYHVEISWVKRRGTPGSFWFTQKKLSGGGVLMDMGPHLLDLFYWLFGDQVAEKYLSSASDLFLQCGDAYANWHRDKQSSELRTDVEDSSFALITYKNMSLSMNLAWASNIENDYAQIKVFGKNGVLDFVTSLGFSTNTLYKKTFINITRATVPEKINIKIEDRKEPFRKMLIDLIRNKASDLPKIESSINVMNDIFNIYKSTSFIKN